MFARRNVSYYQVNLIQILYYEQITKLSKNYSGNFMSDRAECTGTGQHCDSKNNRIFEAFCCFY